MCLITQEACEINSWGGSMLTLSRHMSRLLWRGWSSCTFKELSWGSHAVTSHPSVHFHPNNRRRRWASHKRPRGEEGGTRLVGGQSCDLWTSNRCTLTSQICRCWSESDVTLQRPAGTDTICWTPSRSPELRYVHTRHVTGTRVMWL